MTIKTFGQIRVLSDPDHDSTRFTILTFIDQHVFSDARLEIEGAGYVIKDSFFGYRVFRDAADALDSVSIFCERAT